MCTNSYSNKERFDKVITKIKWCSFLPHSVVQFQLLYRPSIKTIIPVIVFEYFGPVLVPGSSLASILALRHCIQLRMKLCILRSTKPQCRTAGHLLCTRTTLTGHVRRRNALKFMPMKLRTFHCSFALPYCPI